MVSNDYIIAGLQKLTIIFFVITVIPLEDQNKTWPRGSPDEYTALAAFVLT